MRAIFTGVATKISGGNLVPVATSATIEVRRKDTGALAAIYSDEAGTTPITNPSSFQDSSGRFLFYAVGIDRGYEVTVTDGGLTYTLHNVPTGNAAQRDLPAVGVLFTQLATIGKGSVMTGGAANTLLEKVAPSNGRVRIADSGQTDGWSDVPFPKSFRNRVINGDMRIDQANGGGTVTVNSGSIGYSVDTFAGQGTASAGVFTLVQASATPPAGFRTYLRITATTADAAPAATSLYYLRFPIEGYNCGDLDFGKSTAAQVTISFWVRSSLTGSFSGMLTNSASNRAYPYSFTINAANTWEYKSVTIAGDTTGTWLTDNSVGINLGIDLGSGANFRGTAGAWAAANLLGVTGAVRLISTLNATFDITGVQFENGPVATEYDFRDLQAETLRCQRFLLISRIILSTTVAANAPSFLLPTPMRVVPTMSITATDAGTGATLSTTGANSQQAFYQNTANSQLSGATFKADARL